MNAQTRTDGNVLIPKKGQGTELVSMSLIETRPQIRQTIDQKTIEQLAQNIRVHGLIHPISVHRYSDRSLVLIAGHRRLLAAKLIIEEELIPWPIPAVVFEGLSEVEIALLQASENIHEPVRPEESAVFYTDIWQRIKQVRPDFTLRDFCRAVGRSEKAVRQALKFVLLPGRIHEMVQKNTLRYGTAVEISRLQGFYKNSNRDNDHLISWAVESVATAERIKDTRERVNSFLGEARIGQIPLFEPSPEDERRCRRVRINNSLAQAFGVQKAYLKTLLDLVRTEYLPPDDVQWLQGRSGVAVDEVVTILKQLLVEAPLSDQVQENGNEVVYRYHNQV